MATRIQLRRGTAAQWTSANPVLAAGEIGTETDTGKLKVGDGTSTWSALAYIQGEGSSSSWGSLTGSMSAQTDLATALGAKQSTAEKGVASGYASLDSSGLVPAAQLQVALTETRGITRYATSTETATGTEPLAAVTPYALAQSGLIPGAATTTTAGTMSAADKTRLDGIPAPAASDSGKVLGVDSAGAYALEFPVGDLGMIIALGGE